MASRIWWSIQSLCWKIGKMLYTERQSTRVSIIFNGKYHHFRFFFVFIIWLLFWVSFNLNFSYFILLVFQIILLFGFWFKFFFFVIHFCSECLEKLKQETFTEYTRLLSLLPEKLRTHFDNGFTKCLETNIFLNDAVAFKGDIIFPITDEQVECGRVSTYNIQFN